MKNLTSAIKNYKNSIASYKTPELIDRFHRLINYLRISVTDHCNLNCIYCMPDRFVEKLPHKEILRYEEILHLVRTCVQLGVSKVRVTGGEPLVRKNIYEFLSKLTKIEGLTDVSLTTNGVLLKDNIEKIKAAGIKRINISLDTLNREKYRKITGSDVFDLVWEGIEKAEENGFDPVKLNVVVLRGINDDEVTDLASLSFFRPFHIRFIEYMPIGQANIHSEKIFFTDKIKERIEILGKLFRVDNDVNDGPAKRYRFDGAKGEIGFISPVSHHFCNKCNRLRLTANGRLRPCLLSDYQEDIKGPLRSGATEKELRDVFIKAVLNKSCEHKIDFENDAGTKGEMYKIGG